MAAVTIPSRPRLHTPHDSSDTLSPMPIDVGSPTAASESTHPQSQIPRPRRHLPVGRLRAFVSRHNHQLPRSDRPQHSRARSSEAIPHQRDPVRLPRLGVHRLLRPLAAPVRRAARPHRHPAGISAGDDLLERRVHGPRRVPKHDAVLHRPRRPWRQRIAGFSRSRQGNRRVVSRGPAGPGHGGRLAKPPCSSAPCAPCR